MPNARHIEIALTTTSTLDGWEITDYLGPVVAHVVAGSGFVSDFFAGLSDVFGGRSGAYQSQLRSISDEAMGALRRAAYDQRANWVIGVSLGINEVSGKGMQMFMIAATGTAVRAVRKAKSAPMGGGYASAEQSPDPGRQHDFELRRLSLDDVQAAARRYDVLANVETGELDWSPATWLSLTDDRIIEAAPVILKEAGRLKQGTLTATEYDVFRRNAVAYFERLDESDALDALYGSLVRGGAAGEAAAELLAETNRRSLPSILRLLDHKDVEVRRRALQTLKFPQRSYGPEDIVLLEAVAARCEDPATFPLYGVVIAAGGRGLFGAKGEQFRCKCGTERVAEVAQCASLQCGRDRYGFRHREMTSVMGVAYATRAAAFLRRVYADVAPRTTPLGLSGQVL